MQALILYPLHMNDICVTNNLIQKGQVTRLQHPQQDVHAYFEQTSFETVQSILPLLLPLLIGRSPDNGEYYVCASKKLTIISIFIILQLLPFLLSLKVKKIIHF